MFKNKTNLNLNPKAYLFFASIFLFGMISVAYAIDSYTAGTSFVIGEFVYDDDYVGTTTPCTISIWSPINNLVVDESAMTASTTGWHSYTFAGSTTLGTWPAVMSCGTPSVDLVRQDKTFIIASASAGGGATADEVASSVWASSTRSLTNFGTLISDVASAVWASSTRSITTFGTLISDTASAVWSSSTRRLTDKTLTGGGNLATETYIDTATSTIVTRINSLNNISASDVWAVGVRKLSSGGNDDVASAVWASSSRTITSGSAPSAGDVASAVWASSSRSLTNYGNNLSASDVWAVASSSLSGAGTIGKHLVDNINATITSRGTSNLTASDIWTAATRTLTDYSTTSISNAVWANASKTLTSYGNDITAEDVWNVLTSAITTDDTIGKLLNTNIDAKISSRGTSNLTNADLNLATSTIITEILNNRTLINNLHNITAEDVWAAGTRTLTQSSDPTANQIASAVWASTSRSLSDYSAVWSVASSSLTASGSIGKHLAELIDARVSSAGGSSLTAADIWQYGTRALTDYSTSSVASAAATAVWANGTKTLTNYGNDITAEDVWNVLSASLSTEGSIGKQITENINTSTIATAVWNNPTRSLTTFGTLINDIWAYSGGRTLTAFGNLAADVWNGAYAPTRRLTDNTLTGGGTLVTNTDLNARIEQATSTIITEILANRTLINNLNNITANDVWSAGTRTLTDYSTSSIASASANSVWDKASAQLTASGSIGKRIADNLDATISSRGTSSLTATDVWTNVTRTLTDYSTSSVASAAATAVWANGTKTLTNYGNDITAQDVWNVLTSALTSANSIGKLLATNVDATISSRGTSNLTNADLNLATSTIITEILNNRTLINNLHNITAEDVWAAGTRTLTSSGAPSASDVASAVWASTSRSLSDYSAVWAVASSSLNTSGSIGKHLAELIDARVSSAGGSSLTAADIWSYATRDLTNYATSSISASVWANADRTLTNYGNDITAEDVWNVLTATLNTSGSVGKFFIDNIDGTITSRASLANQTAKWDVLMTGPSSVQTGKTYRAKIYVFNATGTLAAPLLVPTVSLYDAVRNKVVSSVEMTLSGTGVYEYTYTIPSNASQGVWETIVNTEVESGKIIQNNDYWEVAGSPAQVIINSVSTTTGTTNVSANLTVTNEGLAGYEYQYEWCIVSSSDNTCGGGDDTYHGTGAKYINPGEDWNTDLTGAVTTNGTYYFKVIVYFGTEKSGSSRSFDMAGLGSGGTPAGGGGAGGGGGGGGGGNEETNEPKVATTKTQSGAITLNPSESGTIKATTNQGIVLNVEIPKDTISSPSIISAKPTPLSSSNVTILPPVNQLSMLGSMVFVLQTSNRQTSFNQPITLTFNYSAGEVKDLDEKTLKVYWYNEQLSQWNSLPTTVDTIKDTLTVKVDHFTTFAIFGQPSKKAMSYNKSDFNHDSKVGSIDFSILLAFWHTRYPFSNPLVDINNDKKVDSVDFSILLSQWGK